jgi:uncharacterized protein
LRLNQETFAIFGQNNMKKVHLSRTVGVLVSVAMTIGIVACGPSKPGIIGNKVRPATPKMDDEQGQCRAVEDFGQPLLVDWKPHQRANLEEAMTDGVAVVSYNCKTLRLLKGCTVEGTYDYLGLSKKESMIRLYDKDEIRANLPGFGGKYVLSLGAELERGASLDVALILVGKKRTTVREVTKEKLKGDGACEGATHFIRGAFVGAFAMKTGTKGKASSVAAIFGAEAGAGSSSEETTMNKDGNPSACNSGEPGSKTPPNNCEALLRLELVKIGGMDDGVKKPKELDSDAVGCPKGMVMSEGKCTRASSAKNHTCKSFDYDDCQDQCSKGNGDSCFRLGEIYELGRGAPKSASKAFSAYSKACEKEVAFGCNNLGVMYDKGIGITADDTQAVKLYEKACKFGSAKGCSNLGYMSENGRGITKNPELAAKLYQRGCSNGDGMGCNNLGVMQEIGKGGLEKNEFKALELFKKACTGGHNYGCANIAFFYEMGKGGLARNESRAFSLYQTPCKNRVGFACDHLGSMYKDGRGTSADMNQAKAHYRLACELSNKNGCAHYKNIVNNSPEALKAKQAEETKSLMLNCQTGDIKACDKLGASFEFGRGVDRDYKRAGILYKKACDGGYAGGCDNYGYMLSAGRGEKMDMQKALTYYKKACDMSFSRSCFSLGTKYEFGRNGIAKNFFMAITYYKKACDMGHGYSCSLLGSLYLSGKKVGKSTTEAIKYFGKACSSGSYSACTKKRELEKQKRKF